MLLIAEKKKNQQKQHVFLPMFGDKQTVDGDDFISQSVTKNFLFFQVLRLKETKEAAALLQLLQQWE